MSNFRHVAPAPALASSTPDPSCTTDLVARFQVGAGRDQGLGDFQAVVVRCLMKRGAAVLPRGERRQKRKPLVVVYRTRSHSPWFSPRHSPRLQSRPGRLPGGCFSLHHEAGSRRPAMGRVGAHGREGRKRVYLE